MGEATSNEKTSHQRIPRRKTRHAPTDEFPMSSSLTFRGASWAVGGGGMAGVVVLTVEWWLCVVIKGLRS